MKTNARGSGMKTFLAVFFSVMLTFTMMPVLPFMTGDVHAVTSLTNLNTNTFDVYDGDVTIANDESDNGKIKVSYGRSLYKDNIDSKTQTITLTTSMKAGTEHSVSVTTKNSVNIILKDLFTNVIAKSDGCAFSISNGTNLSRLKARLTTRYIK